MNSSVFHKIDCIVNNKYELDSNIILSEFEKEIIRNYIEKHNNFVQCTNVFNITLESRIHSLDELIFSVDERTGKLFRDLSYAKLLLEQGNRELYEAANHEVIEDYFKLQMYV